MRTTQGWYGDLSVDRLIEDLNRLSLALKGGWQILNYLGLPYYPVTDRCDFLQLELIKGNSAKVTLMM